MKNSTRFNARVCYVSPWCKSVEMRPKGAILTGSLNYGETGKAGFTIEIGDDEQEQAF